MPQYQLLWGHRAPYEPACPVLLAGFIHGSQLSVLFPVETQFVIKCFEMNLNIVPCYDWCAEQNKSATFLERRSENESAVNGCQHKKGKSNTGHLHNRQYKSKNICQKDQVELSSGLSHTKSLLQKQDKIVQMYT